MSRYKVILVILRIIQNVIVTLTEDDQVTEEGAPIWLWEEEI